MYEFLRAKGINALAGSIPFIVFPRKKSACGISFSYHVRAVSALPSLRSAIADIPSENPVRRLSLRESSDGMFWSGRAEGTESSGSVALTGLWKRSSHESHETG